MPPLSSWLDELLACEDDVLPDELFDRVLARGDAARETLLDVATSPEYRGYGSTGDGLAAVHALDVLAELPPQDATAARLVRSLVDDPESDVALEVADALCAMGAVAAARAVEAIATATHPESAALLAHVLARADLRDDATFAALRGAFDRFPVEVATPLADYGDERALPALRRVFEAHVVEKGRPAAYEDRCIQVAQAIEALAGGLTAEEREKYERSRARQTRLLQRTSARRGDDAEGAIEEFEAPRAPAPNDACPCGSGRKFKKCHEGDAAFLGGAGEDEFDDEV